MRLILMGTGPFAVPSFQALWESGREIASVVTRPVPPPRGRHKGPPNPVQEWACQANLPVMAPPDVNDDAARHELRRLQPDLLVVCDYGQILSAETLDLAPLGGINLHGSLLPKYRGAAPVNWAIWNGEQETGVSVIHMTSRLDAGPTLSTASTPIGPEEDAVALEHRLAQLGVPTVLQAVNLLSSWDGQTELGVKQDPSLATRARRLRKSDGQVHWSDPAHQIANQIRALKPWPGTYTTWLRPGGPLRIILDVAKPVSDPGDTATAAPGTVVRSDQDRLRVATGEGLLDIGRVKPAGKNVMDIRQFLRGYAVKAGDQFGPPTP